MTYEGSCHCGGLRFSFRSEPITTGITCNCSICQRKGLVMSTRYVPPEDWGRMEGLEKLGVYRWGDRMVNNYFCKTCGVYPFHDATTQPGHYRVNLGCVEGLDLRSLELTHLDRRDA